jgi:hypothetical protein
VAALTLMPNVALNSQLSYEKRDYNKALVPLFLINRADKESSVGVNLNWKLNKNLSLQPNYTYTQNQSNIHLVTTHAMW